MDESNLTEKTLVMCRYEKLAVMCAISVFCVIALLSLIWPTYRSFLGTMINDNEGWNAFYADAAMGKMKLYPSLDKLITNNYPPLSFYFVGGVGKLIGDNIFAGRLISLIAVLVTAFFIAKIIKKLNGSLSAAVVGGAYFVATMALFFRGYVGMNDPQLLAQAIMTAGFFLFLKAAELDKGYWLPMLVMVVAGFFKHNIITLPLSALLWLAFQRRWKPLVFCCCLSFFFIIAGFSFCYLAYGTDFFYNLMMPRQFIVAKMMDGLVDLRAVAPAMAGWFFISWKFRVKPYVSLITIMILTGLLLGLVQCTGSGVFYNAMFDLVMAVAIAVGVSFNLLEKKVRYAETLQLAFIVMLCLTLIMAPNIFSFIHNFSPAYREKIVRREVLMAEKIAEVRATPGDVFCEAYVAFRAGKSFIVDSSNVRRRIQVGKLPKDAITRRINNHTLTEIKSDQQIGLE